MSDLPRGWEWARFADVARVVAKFVDPSHHRLEPHIASNHIESGTGRLLSYGTVVGDEVVGPKRQFSAGQLLYSKIRPSLAKVAYVDFSGVCSADICPVDCFIDPQYLKWWMLTPTFIEFATDRQTDTTIPRISKEALESLPVPVPPLTEQRRIVAILEEHMLRLDETDLILRRASSRIGDLVAATRLCFAAQFHGGDQALGDVLDRIEAGKSLVVEKRQADGGEWGVIKTSAIRRGEFDPSENKAVPPEQRVDLRHEIQDGDILLNRANSKQHVGSSVLVRTTRPRLLLSDKSLRLIPNESVEPEWLAEILASPGVRRQLSQKAHGTIHSMRNISQSALRTVRIPVATWQQQRAAVNWLRPIRATISRLERQFANVSARTKVLRQSLLIAAFAGRLVSQDVNDESVSLLLARIKPERMAQSAVKRRRRPQAREPEQGRLF